MRFYDGRNALAHAVTLTCDATHLRIAAASGGELACWPRGRLTVGKPDPDGVVMVSCRGEPGRLLISADDPAGELPPGWLPPGFAPRGGSREARRSGGGTVPGWTAAAVGCTLLFCAAGFLLLGRAPALVARWVPASVENRLGANAEATFLLGHSVCRGAAGQAALDALEARLARGAGIAQPVRVTVVDDALVNAMTLPGNRILVMKGLIAEVGSGDQLAGVMAHETAHVAHRDPMQALVRSTGIQVLVAALGLNTGFGDVSGLAGSLLNLSYSRATERRADAGGVAALRASGLRSDGLADFFANLEKREGDTLPAFLSDHPDTAERRRENRGSPQGQSALSAAQWRAVRSMCDAPPKQP